MAVAGVSLFQSLIVSSFMVFCGAEHIAVHKGPRVLEPHLASGFLSTSKLEQRAELHHVIASSVGSLLSSQRARDDYSCVAASMEPMWRSLAKNKYGRVDHRSLFYAVHRYMLKFHAVSIMGLEPTASTNETVDATFLKTHAPMLVKEALEGAAAGEGFSKDDAVAVVLMLKYLVKMSAEPHMQEIFNLWRIPEGATVKLSTLRNIMKSRFFETVLGGDAEGIQLLREDMGLLKDFFEESDALIAYVDGAVSAYRFTQRNPFKADYSYEEALEIASAMSLSSGLYWETECKRVKDLLSSMDAAGTGRVRLADFHDAAFHGEWRFSESKEYLRHLGALDETSALAGPRVIISNYLQGPSNCIVSTPTFRICCANDCESHLAEIEAAVNAPAALPEQILTVVANITTYSDDKVPISAKIRAQLFDIALVHNGVVPLHGRLFGQWLHFVFPLDCRFPHKSGSTGSMSFFEFGEESLASTEEIEKHAAVAKETATAVNGTQIAAQTEDWLSQWSDEEELISASAHFQAPWDTSILASAVWPCLLTLTVFSYVALVVNPEKLWRCTITCMKGFQCWPTGSHSHII